jgi:polysaccharide biosynthesis protein PslH
VTNPSIRTLFLTLMSYPPIGGAPLRNWQNINIMKQWGAVGVFAVSHRDNSCETIDEVDLWHHYNISTQTTPKILLERFGRWVQHWGLSFYWGYLSDAARRLDQVMTEFKPDLVVFEELWLYHYLPVVQRHQCQIIFDAHNVEVPLYKETKCSDQSFIAKARTLLHLPQIEFTEKGLIHNADQVWVCSQEDQALLGSLYQPSTPIYTIPNGIDVKSYDDVRLGRCSPPKALAETAQNFIFPGNFMYPPNAEAAKVLIEEIYPRLRTVYPKCRLLLVGRGVTGWMQKIATQESGIIVTGEVPDIRPYIAAASVMVVPLYKGGGTRFKILEAFAAGCPVVSTTKGAEGLNSEDGVHLLLRDDVEALTEGIIKIWSDASLRERLVHNGYDLVQSNYSWDAVSHHVKLAVEDLLNHPKSNI